MIHHLSIAAHSPREVSEFLAEIMDGASIDFPPNPGSFMAFSRDRCGTAVEIYPAGTVMQPAGDEGADFLQHPSGRPAFTATHFALSVDRSPEQIREAAAARGWSCFECDRGGHFSVMEVWIENCVLVELLPPAFAADYLAFARLMTEGGTLQAHAPKLDAGRVRADA